MLKGKGLLTNLQRSFLEIFAKIPDQNNFYLTGGTALSEYYLGHRFSYDLDLFTAEGDLILPLSYKLEQIYPLDEVDLSITRRFSSFVEFILTHKDESVRVDIAQDSPFQFAPPQTSEIGVYVNNLKDLLFDPIMLKNSFQGLALDLMSNL